MLLYASSGIQERPFPLHLARAVFLDCSQPTRHASLSYRRSKTQSCSLHKYKAAPPWECLPVGTSWTSSLPLLQDLQFPSPKWPPQCHSKDRLVLGASLIELHLGTIALGNKLSFYLIQGASCVSI